MALTKEQFLGTASQLKTDVVDVPELGKVTVRELTTAQRGQLEADMHTNENATFAAMRPWVVAMSVMNGDGLMFEPKDVDAIGGLPASVTTPIFDRVLAMSGLTAKDREELEKKSEPSR